MNNDQDSGEARPGAFIGQLTGWEDVVFELEDVPEDTARIEE